MQPPLSRIRRRLTLRQLEVFEAIARLGSFSRAAEELHLTQPTVSVQMKKLTDTVGQPLLEHLGKRIYLTDAGRALQLTCRELFSTLERFEMTTANLQGMTKGALRLAVITTAKYFAPRLLAPFCQRFPGIDASLKVTNREQVLARLQDNQDDLYIFGRPPDNVPVVSTPFLRNPLVALAPPGHPLADRRQVPLEDFARYPFLAREPGSGTRRAVEQLYEEHGLELNIRMELGSNEAIKHSVAAGMGVSVLSRHTLVGGSKDVTLLDVEGFPIERHWYLVYPEGKQLSVAAQAFLTYLEEEGRQIVDAALAEAGEEPSTER